MAQPGSRGEFIDYCKRQLGAPVLEINIADEQVEDIVDDAIQFFNERHFDGVSQVFLKYQITQDDIDRGTASMEEGAETKAGKAALIAKQILAAQEMIQEARKTITFSSLVAARSSAAVAEGTAQTAKIGFPQNIPMLIAYALQAVGIISAISSAVGKSKSVAGSIGASGGVSVDTRAAA